MENQMTSPTIDIQMTEQQMRSLGKQIELTRSKLSPLIATNEQQVEAAGGRVLNPDLVTPDGRIRPELASPFQVLATAQSFTMVGYVGRSLALEVAAYYPGATSSQEGVSLTNIGDTLQLQSPPIMESVLEILRQYIGDVLLRRVEFEVDLPLMEAWLLFGIVDVGRRRELNRILGHEGDASETLSVEEIHGALESPVPGTQWLAPYLNDCLSLASPTLGEVSAGLKRLTERGLAQITQSGLILGEVIQQIVAEFLLVDSYARVRAASLDSADEVLSTDMRAIQGRSGSIMVWSYDDASIHLIGVSPAQFMIMMSSLVENPGAILSGGSPLSTAAVAAPPPPEVLQ